MPTARQVTWAKFRVFAVMAVAFVILSVLFYLLTGGTLLQEKATIYLYIPDATGLASGSPVRVDGIDVGKVDKVALSGLTQPDRIVRVSIIVERQWLPSIPSDSYAQLSSDSLIGDKFVDVSSGRSRTPLHPNSELIYRERPDITKRLDLAQFRKQIAIVDAMLTDIEQGRGPLGQFVQGEGMYDEWRKLLRESQAGIDALVARKGTIGSHVYTEEAYQKLRKIFLDFDQSLAKLQSGQGDLGALLKDDAQYRQYVAGLGDLRNSLAQLSGSPFMQSEADYANWSRGLRDLSKALDQFNASPMLATADTYDSLTGMMKELQTGLKDFRTDPRKYMRLKVF